MVRICFVILASVLMSIGTVHTKPISFTIDFCQFAGKNGETRIEVYYAYPDTTVTYTKKDNTYIGQLQIHQVIKNTDGLIVNDNIWRLENIADKPITVHRMYHYSQKVLLLQPGTYTMSIEITDPADPTTVAKREVRLNVRSFGKPYIEASDLQLSQGISPVDPNKNQSNFTKHGLNVLPNPMQEVVGTDPVVTTYCELYNVKKYAGDTVAVLYRIFDGVRRVVASKEYTRLVGSDTMIEHTSLGLNGLPSGVYFIQLSVASYKNESDVAYSTKKMYILNPAMPPRMAAPYSEDELFSMSEWATMGEKTLMDEFEKAQYIVTKTESELFAELVDVKAKQKFMYRFWSTRDPNKETIENERLLEYRRAIQYADIHYSNPRIGEGWRTDMGRVLCKYGFPTTIDRGNVVAESNAYQTWYYDRTQGGINFNFVDIHNVNNYVLVHSNAINEVRNENWMNVYVHKSRNDMNNSTNGQRR